MENARARAAERRDETVPWASTGLAAAPPAPSPLPGLRILPRAQASASKDPASLQPLSSEAPGRQCLIG